MESVRPCSAFPDIQDILKGCLHTHHLPELCRVLRASVCTTNPTLSCEVICPHV